jgi:hypothetical protein
MHYVHDLPTVAAAWTGLDRYIEALCTHCGWLDGLARSPHAGDRHMRRTAQSDS